MRGRFYSSEDREKAKALVATGKSYSEIFKLIGVPKSTLSTWYSGTVKKPRSRSEMLKHLTSIRSRAVKVIIERARTRRAEEDKKVAESVTEIMAKLPYDQVLLKKTMLAMLYWAEGSKHEKMFGLKFVNTDPRLASLFITLLRECYEIDEKRFSIGLHLHYYHSKSKSIDFWSKLLKVPKDRFSKPYFKKRHKTKRFRKNFAGMCSIYYGSNFIRKEMMSLAYSLQKFIIKPIQ